MSVSAAPLSRQQLDSAATRLAEHSPNPKFGWILRQDLYTLFVLLAILRHRGGLRDVTDIDFHGTDVNHAARRMLQSFSSGNDQGVTWEIFDAVVEHTMVFTPPLHLPEACLH